MSMGLNFREKYNQLLKRYYKAEQFINNCSDSEFEKWYPKFITITEQLSNMMQESKNKYNYEMKDQEILEGFKIE